MSPRPRVLLAITVYNGRGFVFRTVDSAARLLTETVDLDVLYLDDASPDVEFAKDLEVAARAVGHGYYRSPRNLGIVRNVNLGLLRAISAGYDYVIVSNSDVIYPATMVDQLAAVMAADPTLGSATSWSNNVSIYSLPNTDPDNLVSSQQFVDYATADLTDHFGTRVLDIPAGISFAMIIRTAALESVGLMDLVFGKGYCEETDWSQRSLLAGWRLTLAPSVFVYHAGRGSTLAAGMLSGDDSSVAENERVIDHRYPRFRHDVAAFEAEGNLARLIDEGLEALLVGQANRAGVDVALANSGTAVDQPERVCVRIGSDFSSTRIELCHRGFRVEREIGEDELVALLRVLRRDDAGPIPQLDPRPPAQALAARLRDAGIDVVETGGPNDDADPSALGPARYPWAV